MPIEIRDDWYYSAFFYADGYMPESEQKVDIMGAMFKEAPTDDPNVPWKMIWRFRYYNDKHNFNSKDEKSWYSATLKPGEDTKTATDKLERWINMSAATMTNRGFTEFIRINGNGPEMYEKALKNKPWAHGRAAPEGQLEKHGIDLPSTDKFFAELQAKGTTDAPSNAPAVEWLK